MKNKIKITKQQWLIILLVCLILCGLFLVVRSILLPTVTIDGETKTVVMMESYMNGGGTSDYKKWLFSIGLYHNEYMPFESNQKIISNIPFGARKAQRFIDALYNNGNFEMPYDCYDPDALEVHGVWWEITITFNDGTTKTYRNGLGYTGYENWKTIIDQFF